MKRPLLALALALTTVATGCGDDNPPGELLVYWQFAHRAADGTDVIYDSVPAGAGQRTCPQSGVDYMTIRDTSGRDVDRFFPTFDCVNELGDQGIVVELIRPGTHTWVITGYRGDFAIYETAFTFDVRSDRLTVIGDGSPGNPPPVTLGGILDDLEILARLATTGVPPQPLSCEQIGATTLTYSIVDWAGTETRFGTFPCVGGSPSILLPGVERDNYAVRIQALSAANVPVGDTLIPVAQGCGAEFDPLIDHYSRTQATVPVYDIRSFGSVCP
jgi:hypothetical protein